MCINYLLENSSMSLTLLEAIKRTLESVSQYNNWTFAVFVGTETLSLTPEILSKMGTIRLAWHPFNEIWNMKDQHTWVLVHESLKLSTPGPEIWQISLGLG